MPIVTDRYRAVAGSCPGVVVIAHDVTIGARLRIVREVRVALRVDEGITADADGEPDQYRGDDEQSRSRHVASRAYSNSMPRSRLTRW